MAVVRTSRSITFSALNDTVADVLALDSLSLVGTGMTPGTRLTLKDGASTIIADHYVASANENVEFLNGQRKTMRGLTVTAAPTGTWTVLGRLV